MNQKVERKIAGAIRIAMVSIVILLQILLIIFLMWKLQQHAVYVYFIIEVIAVLDIVFLVSSSKNTSYTIAWILVIFLLPVFGYILYILWGNTGIFIKNHTRIKRAIKRGFTYLKHDADRYKNLEKEHSNRKRIANYLKCKQFPLYQNTKCDYFPLGELQFEAMVEDLKRAEKFIFLEYFIINNGELWDRISDILFRKAKEGVEVRLMFDDLGSIITVSDKLIRTLKNKGIEAIRFNPIQRYISRLYVNYRNHQKITVIDGNIGYTGGTNLADEYANLYSKYGHWKDTAIRMEGDAVWSLTVTFLQMWEAESNVESDYELYRPTSQIKRQSFFQPFSDGPANNPDNPAEGMYRNMINSANEYLYITTPYLIIDNTMMDTLCTAALSGIDVRIITPKIGDHWYVHMVTQSNYGELLKAGVRIYEYTPGYIHAKTIISDDDHAVTGSINMDYRSFYLHYENGVWICGDPILKKIKRDILDTLKVCEEIHLDAWQSRHWYVKAIQTVLRIFAVIF